MFKYDYICVGAGLFNSVFARTMTDAGKRVLILEKRSHLGGNCFSEDIQGIDVHKYGPHIMHTNDDEVWEFIQKYTPMNRFSYRPKVMFEGKLYSFPINLSSLNQIWGITTPEEALDKLASEKIPMEKIDNLEDWCLSEIGPTLYNIFIRGYTAKQWGKSPRELPTSIIKRIPVRTNFNDDYFNDKYQGIPSKGYGHFFRQLLEGIEVIYNSDYLRSREHWDSIGEKVIYTGKIDEFYNYQLGELGYRSLKFETTTHLVNDFQGNVVINYTEESVPYTRIVEHKHFHFGDSLPHSIITKEFPQAWTRDKEAYYPLRDKDDNSVILERYQELSKRQNKVYFKGRLGEYKYIDMCPTIANSLQFAKEQRETK